MSKISSVAIIGAGPVGLAAACHLLERGLRPIILEGGAEAGSSIRAWQHVHMFSPWQYNVDKAARRMLEQTGWISPDASAIPTGRDLIQFYLQPLSQLPIMRPLISYRRHVVAVSRKNFGKVKSNGRDDSPFIVRTRSVDGHIQDIEADAVIDASGTWQSPNPLGPSGLPVPGESESARRIFYGIPDVKQLQHRYAGRRILVAGAGHSAINALLDLARLRSVAPNTKIYWAVRRDVSQNLFGGGAADQLPARGALGEMVRDVIDAGDVTLLAPFLVDRIDQGNVSGGLIVWGALRNERQAIDVDEIVVATGFRPNLDILREIRLGLDSWLEAPQALAPLIDPNLHSCGTVRPHGAEQLAHPESNFYIAGMKSYGRAPTFLLATGYEQVRSIAASLAGDHVAASRVELELPQTGVCKTRPDSGLRLKSDGAAKGCGTKAGGCQSTTAIELPA